MVSAVLNLILAGALVVMWRKLRALEAKAEAAPFFHQETVLRRIIDLIPYCVFWKDRDLEYLGCNQRFAELAGLESSAEIIGKTDFNLPWKHEEALGYRADDRGVIDSEAPKLHIIETQRNTDNELNWLDTSKVPLVDEDGGTFGVLGIFTDITEQVRNKEELERINAELKAATASAERASESKSEFLANMSHEIRTPLTAILGYLDLLDDPTETEAHPEHIDTIRANAHHLLRIINDILDLSKIEAGKLELELIPCSVEAIVGEVQALMRVRADHKGLALEIERATDLPETISSDPTRLRQILLNLVGNAIKFTLRGRVTMRLAWLPDPASTTAGRLRVEVEDTGEGIPGEKLDRLFVAFSQADSSVTRRHGGTGLGLTIARRLARRLGGDLTVRSEIGEGSCFSFEIETRALEAESSSGASRGTRPASTSDAPLTGLRVLVAEDVKVNQKLVRRFLEKAGAQVELADDGREAMQKVRGASADGRPPFDVVLMDMQMPEVDGYTATRELRTEGYSGPIVALTAHAMASDKARCLAAGCTDFLSKPIDRQALIEMVADHSVPQEESK
ncbi:MAG: ATP-binding protein [Myxococcota bacterium]